VNAPIASSIRSADHRATPRSSWYAATPGLSLTDRWSNAIASAGRPLLIRRPPSKAHSWASRVCADDIFLDFGAREEEPATPGPSTRGLMTESRLSARGRSVRRGVGRDAPRPGNMAGVGACPPRPEPDLLIAFLLPALPLAPFLTALPGAAVRVNGPRAKFAHHQVGRRTVFC
jgi:hypothetical protein